MWWPVDEKKAHVSWAVVGRQTSEGAGGIGSGTHLGLHAPWQRRHLSHSGLCPFRIVHRPFWQGCVLWERCCNAAAVASTACAASGGQGDPNHVSVHGLPAAGPLLSALCRRGSLASRRSWCLRHSDIPMRLDDNSATVHCCCCGGQSLGIVGGGWLLCAEQPLFRGGADVSSRAASEPGG